MSSLDLWMVAWPLPSKRQLARIGASDHVVGTVSRGTQGAASWREALDAVSTPWYADGSVTGPRRRRMLEGTSTTSQNDIRW